MANKPCTIDCEKILQMLREKPYFVDTIIELVREFDEFDDNCEELIEAIQHAKSNEYCVI